MDFTYGTKFDLLSGSVEKVIAQYPEPYVKHFTRRLDTPTPAAAAPQRGQQPNAIKVIGTLLHYVEFGDSFDCKFTYRGHSTAQPKS